MMCAKIVFMITLGLNLILVDSDSPNASTCEVEGIVRQNFEKFQSGAGDCAQCECMDNEINCDGSLCQTLIMNENDEHSRHRRSVENCTTANLAVPPTFREYANPELSNIIQEIGRELAKMEYKRISNILSPPDNPCPLSMFMSYLEFQRSSRALTNIDFRIGNLTPKRFINSDKNQNRIEIYSSQVSVSNNSTLRQEVSTLSYSLTVTKTDEMIISRARDIISNGPIEIPFVGTGAIPVTFSGQDFAMLQRTQQFTIKAPAQNAVLDPYTKMRLQFIFYQYITENHYWLDFDVGDSWIEISDFLRNTFYGDSNCCNPCYVLVKNHTMTSSLNKFSSEHMSTFNAIQYQNGSAIRLEQNQYGQIVLRNFPLTERIMNFGVDILYQAPEKI